MGLFGKKEKKEEPEKLPPLPKLPEIPSMHEAYGVEDIYSNEDLPEQFPDLESYGRGVGKDIKRAISGEEDLEETQENQLPAIPERKLFREEIPEEISGTFQKTSEIQSAKRLSKTEPIFVRIDRFQEALNAFSDAKKKVSEIEKILSEVRSLKEKEEKEIQEWEKELSFIKQQIEKIDSEIFSSV
jgi:hypothetical protein